MPNIWTMILCWVAGYAALPGFTAFGSGFTFFGTPVHQSIAIVLLLPTAALLAVILCAAHPSAGRADNE